RLPKSTTRTSGGMGAAAKRRATSLPKASSPRKRLPTPAMRMRGFIPFLHPGFRVVSQFRGADIPVCHLAVGFPGRQECLPHETDPLPDFEFLSTKEKAVAGFAFLA